MTNHILVTGATGRQGGTGRAVVSLLREKGLPVRAMVRREDDRSEALKKTGAEIVVGDFHDFESLSSAFANVKAAYFCYPVGAGIAEAAGLFASAGKQQGVERIVDLSLAAARPDSPSPQGRAQWVAEQIFEWAGIPGTHLRIAAFFMENLLMIDGPGIRKAGRIANSFGDAIVPWISGTDVGALAASLLINPRLADSRVVVAGGVERQSYADIAARMARIVGKAVRYEELPPAVWRSELVEASKARGQANERGADHLVAQSITLREKPIPSVPDRVEEFVGRQPINFDRFISDHRDEFTPGS